MVLRGAGSWDTPFFRGDVFAIVVAALGVVVSLGAGEESSSDGAEEEEDWAAPHIESGHGDEQERSLRWGRCCMAQRRKRGEGGFKRRGKGEWRESGCTMRPPPPARASSGAAELTAEGC
ncbi:hypothetical protein L7F22_069283 [Adiantum nelumboides]|nr:hypothetical protein [Adiantum nelumboides]